MIYTIVVIHGLKSYIGGKIEVSFPKLAMRASKAHSKLLGETSGK